MYQLNVTIRAAGTHLYRFKDHKNATQIEDRLVTAAFEHKTGSVSFKDDYGSTATFAASDISGVALTDFEQSFKSEEEVRIMTIRSQMRAESRAAQDPEIKQMSMAQAAQQQRGLVGMTGASKVIGAA